MNIKQQFNFVAKEYDANRKKFIPCFDDYYDNSTKLIVSNIEKPRRVLDLGAGTGLLSYFWYQQCSSAEYVLVDIAVKDNEIVGIIFGSGRYEKYIPIDIEVLVEHRKRGIAKALTSAFVKHCIECDLIPHWDCVESNTGSIRLAESIGFEKIKERRI